MPSPEFIAARIAKWTPTEPKGPVTLEIYPTLRCNLDCSFCDTTDRHRPPINELSTETWLRIIDEAADYGAQQAFVLGGGEPMIRQDIITLMTRIKERGLRGMLTTNGTLLSATKRDAILDIGWDEIHFSIDGATAEVHDSLRGKQGSFKKAIQAACYFHVHKKKRKQHTPQIVLHFVLTNKNIHQLRQMVELAEAIGATRIDYDALIAYRPEQKALELSPKQLHKLPALAEEAQQLAKELGIQTTLDNFIQVDRPQRGSTPPPSSDRPGLAGAPCLKAWHHLVIQADGKSSPCCVLAGEGGSIVDQSLSELWHNDPFLQQVRKGMTDHNPLPRCRECSWNILRQEWIIRDLHPVQ